MIRSLLLVFISSFGFPVAAWSQEGAKTQLAAYNSFDFFYIDNSNIPGVGGLHGSLIDLLSDKLAAASKSDSNKCWVYISNGNTPSITDNPENVNKIANQLFDHNTEYPSVSFEERNRITRELYKTPFQVKKRITFHFFITDRLAQTIVEDIPLVVGMMPRDIMLDYGTPQTEAMVYLYFRNNDNKVDLKETLRSLEFSDRPNEKLKGANITYRVYEHT
jgi:hypothetical protein